MPPPRWLAYVVATLAVGAWMGLAVALRVDPNGYLLLGVPLLIVFQIGLARRPLTEVWFADGSGLRMSPKAWAAAAAFMIFPLYKLGASRPHAWGSRLWLLCAVAGAVPLGASLVRMNRERWALLKLCLCSAGGIGILFMALAAVARWHTRASLGIDVRLERGVSSFLLYLPVCFMLEEVFFRGALDSYVRRSDNSEASAIFVSLLWGLWHLPAVAGAASVSRTGWFGVACVLAVVHILVGRFLSEYWRRSGLLLIPAATHALVDAVRNGLI